MLTLKYRARERYIHIHIIGSYQVAKTTAKTQYYKIKFIVVSEVNAFPA